VIAGGYRRSRFDISKSRRQVSTVHGRPIHDALPTLTIIWVASTRHQATTELLLNSSFLGQPLRGRHYVPGREQIIQAKHSVHANRGPRPGTTRKRIAVLGCVLRAEGQELGSTWADISRFSLAGEVDGVLAANLFESCRRR
jgi:hypothetical protein